MTVPPVTTAATASAPTVQPGEIPDLTAVIHSLTGVVLDASKAYLINSRLGPLLAVNGIATFADLTRRLRQGLDRRLAPAVIDAITTQETYFFRDRSPFDLLRFKVLPDTFDRIAARGGSGPSPLRIWSAACSTGQELYSIAMMLRDLLPDPSRWRIQLLGTDISDSAVARASYGLYNRTEIERGLSPQLRARWFQEEPAGWKIRDELRAMAAFRRINLLEPLAGMGRFDIILCRNVAIYFSAEDRRRLFEGLANQLNPGGVLMIGASESLIGVTRRFQRREYHGAVYYELTG